MEVNDDTIGKLAAENISLQHRVEALEEELTVAISGAPLSDKEKLEALFTEFGVGFESGNNSVCCKSGADKIDGFAFFFTIFEFDAAGKFKGAGLWE